MNIPLFLELNRKRIEAGKIGLSRPAPSLVPSFLAAVDEGEKDFTGQWLMAFVTGWPVAGDGWAGWMRRLVKAERGGKGLTLSGMSVDMPASVLFWAVRDGEALGTVSFRFDPGRKLLLRAGHVGYWVRPSARRGGVATYMLGQMLLFAAANRMDEVVVTCDPDNIASERTIRGCGGVPHPETPVYREKGIPPKLRFRIPSRG